MRHQRVVDFEIMTGTVVNGRLMTIFYTKPSCNKADDLPFGILVVFDTNVQAVSHLSSSLIGERVRLTLFWLMWAKWPALR